MGGIGRQTLLGLLIVGCAVEAGNADKEEDTKSTGTVQLLVTSSDTQSGSGLFLNLTSVEVRGYGQNQDDLYTTLPPAGDSVNLYESTDDTEGLALTNEQSVEVGIYEEITVVLNEDKPVTYVDGFNFEAVGEFEDQSINAFVVNERFQVVSGQTTTIVINLDTQLQATDGDPGRFKIKPRAKLFRKERGVVYKGEIDDPEAVSVCAYGYNLLLPPPPPPRSNTYRGPPPPPRFEASLPPVFESADDLVKDETATCSNAFARARVASGQYFFKALLPGSYDLRVFYQDGSFEDLEIGLVLEPPVAPTPPAQFNAWKTRSEEAKGPPNGPDEARHRDLKKRLPLKPSGP